MRATTTTLVLLFSTLALAAPTPLPKDNKLLLPPTDLGQHTGKIGVDNVDLNTKLRVDPVRIDLHNRQDAGQGSPVADPNAMRPSPYSDKPVEKRVQREKNAPEDVPRWKKKYNAEYDWMSPA
ncbi:hypothetical protein CGCSCA4_v013011 [Colletotrichum siamense]|uniref:Uncharacterized protein n=1 Tax=Colletotrichum siamense TaxID=690259 RepID=A0A9P5EIV6_COLSI|nr:hypothetical protein CGCSCA4_v013011 [Colletotrichum siamense]KAF4848132.1 hypothetical protein CGCSCA2_v012506 [Colletotrichum siamense]